MASFKKINNKWSVVFDLPNHSSRQQKRLSGFNNRQEANLAYVEFLANYKPLAINPPKSGRLDTHVNTFLEHLRQRIKESSFYKYDKAFKRYIIPSLGNKQLTEIKPVDILNWRVSLNELRYVNKELSHATKSKITNFLSQFFNYCVDLDILPSNPCKKLGTFKNTDIKKEMLVWTEDEFIQFISVVDDILYKAFFSFLYLTGVRRGEALALTWKDLRGNIVRISKTLGYAAVNGGYTITSPKNTHSDREIVLPENLLAILEQLKNNYKNYKPDNFIFGNDTPLPPETIRRKLKSYCLKAGVKVIRLHDFRHSHASLLISKGHDIVTIARRLGHADIEMTLNRYAHLMPNKQNELIKSLEIKI